MSKFRNEINSILKDIQKGETEKQQLLYSKTVNFLKIIALKYSTDKSEYEDILVEAYLRIFRYIGSFDSKKDGYNWMCRIVQNVANDFNSKVSTSLPLEEVTFTNILGDELDRLIDKDDLLADICALSDKEQQLIYLRFYDDLTYIEIAKRLNSKRSTVHKQIDLIIKKLGK